MTRPLVTAFDANGLNLDAGSEASIKAAKAGNNFSGVMDLTTKTIYLGPLAPPLVAADDHYNTVAPDFQCFVASRPIDPILHNSPTNPTTSHHQLAVFLKPGSSDFDEFCGFALRFGAGGKAQLAPTSRTLNPGGNGQLEEPILEKLYLYLVPVLARANWTLERSGPRVTPDQAQLRRGGPLIPAGLLGQLRRI